MTDATYKLAPADAPRASVRTHVSLVFSWGDALHAVALRSGQSLVVGRAEPAQVVLEDRSLSRTHARLTLREGLVVVQDLESTNGVTLNGRSITEASFGEGDLVCLGSVELRVSGLVGELGQTARWLSDAEWTRRAEAELARTRVFGRGAAVVAVRTAMEARPALPLREVDLACVYAPRVLLLLLPEAGGAEVAGFVEQVRRFERDPVAVGYALAPTHAASVDGLIAGAIEALRTAKPGGPAQAAELGRERPQLAAPVIASPAMQRVYELVGRIARTTLPVLVLGETGSGKELVARAVHDKSPRAKGAFKALNCATIPGNLIESVLFGHERGAFTGADKQAAGMFEQAQGGTVFLDEVGELSAQAQAALLRVLETKRLVRVGGSKEIEVDVRVVAATHRDLSAMVAAGGFREDLMFRLDALTVRVPPLRERREEIGVLAKLFLARAGVEWGAGEKTLSEDALEALEAFAWPGNVRQLKNVIERAVAVARGDVVELEDLPEALWAEAAAPGAGAGGASGAGGEALGAQGGGAQSTFRSLPDRVREFEIALIKEALAKAHGNQAQAARMLGVPRRTLANKVHAYGLVG